MAAGDGQVILVPTLGSHEVVAVSVCGGTTAMDLVPMGGAAVQGNNGQPDKGLIGLVEHTLDGLEVKYLRESEEAFFTISETDSGPLTLRILVVGDEDDVLRIVCTDHRKIPKRDWQRALAKCNSYHAQFRFGRVYLEQEEGQSESVFRFDAQHLVPEGVSEGVLGHFIYANLVCALRFFETAGGGTGSSSGGDQSASSRKQLPAAGRKRRSRKPGFIQGLKGTGHAGNGYWQGSING